GTQLYFLSGAVPSQDHTASLTVQFDALLSYSTRQVKRLAGYPVSCQRQCVVGDSGLQRRQHLGCCREVTVGRNQPLDARVGPLEVVMVDEQPDPLSGIVEPLEDRHLTTLSPQRPPEPLDLAKRLGMPRPAHHMSDPTPLEQLAEHALASPRVVLR